MFVPQLAGGWIGLRTMSSTDPTKRDAWMCHLTFGVMLVVLTVVRLVLRVRVAHLQAGRIAL